MGMVSLVKASFWYEVHLACCPTLHCLSWCLLSNSKEVRTTMAEPLAPENGLNYVANDEQATGTSDMVMCLGFIS